MDLLSITPDDGRRETRTRLLRAAPAHRDQGETRQARHPDVLASEPCEYKMDSSGTILLQLL